MSGRLPGSVARFLEGHRIAVAGVARDGRAAANLILRRLRETGHEVVPVNPHAAELEGERCYPDLASIPGTVDGVIVATHPDVSAEIVRQAVARGISRIWFHRSFGQGSVSDEAVSTCAGHGIEPVVGGCPLMYCGNVDFGHRCMKWILRFRDRLPRATA